MNPRSPDDVDRLFTRLRPIEPPADFVERVALASYAAPPAVAPGRRLWLVLDVAAIALLAAVSFWFGMTLERTGALDLLALLVLDVEAARLGFGSLIEALAATVPWLELGLLAVNVAAVVALSVLALRGAGRAARPAL